MNPEERRGILTLLIIITAIAAWRIVGCSSDDEDVLPVDSAIVRTIEVEGPSEKGGSGSLAPTPFDPNTADSLTMLRAGLKPWQIGNVRKYVAKGGRWRNAAHFRQLYGLTDEQYQQILPYLRFETANSRQPEPSSSPNTNQPDSTFHRFPKQEKYAPGTVIDINTADTTALKKIPGIGTYYAKRICEYRERMGGFVSTNQLREIEGLPADLDKWIKVEASPVLVKIKINTATFKQIIRHPYLNYEQTKSIVRYRDKYGPLRSFQPLTLDSNFQKQDFDRLAPYIDFSTK